MFGSELLAGVWFFAVTACFTAIGLPFTLRLFEHKTLGYVTAKLVGLLLFGYGVWLFASFKLLNYQSVWIIQALFLACGLVGIILVWQYFGKSISPSKNTESKPRLLKVLVWEGLGLLVYLAYLLLRAHNPEINGTERFMDMALLSSSGKTDFFPFVDPWYAGKLVNYYYYGAYLVSLISNLARLPTALTYNFALGFIFSQSALLAGTLVYALSKSKLFALLGAVLLTSGGTLFFANCVVQGALKIPPVTCSYASSTRLFDPSYIINEIPSYSFTVGDLHAHLLALPFFLLALILLYALWQADKPRPLLLALLIISIASIGLTNTWDMITLACLTALVGCYKLWQAWREKNIRLMRHWLIFGIILAAGVSILLYPGLKHFENPVLGLGYIPRYVRLHNLSNVQWPTPLVAQVGMWGILLAGILFSLLSRTSLRAVALRSMAIFAALTGKLILPRRHQSEDHHSNDTSTTYPLVLFGLSIGIIVGVELFFIRDIYSIANPPYFRANTTFKFGYHAWTMLCIAFAAGLGTIWTKANKTRRAIAGWIMGIALLSGLVYPLAAIKQFYLSNTVDRSLDGAGWMAKQTPEDAKTVAYINQYIPKRVNIAEAVGDSYTTFSRITTFTGNITPMGWQTHEWTWRFQGKNALRAPVGASVETGWGAVSTVAGDIKTLYETGDIQNAKQIIERYKIQYVYVGGLERTTYLGLNENKFQILGKPVFNSGSSTLYRVAQN